MFTTDSDLKMRIGLPPVLHRHAYQLTHTIAVERLERIKRQDLHLLLEPWLRQAIDVFEQELALGIVAADTKGGLCQVVGTEAEEFRFFRNLTCSQGSTRQLNHRTELVLDGNSSLLR